MLKSLIYKYLHKGVSRVQSNIESQIPKLDLQEKHISSLKVLTNRNALLKNLPKNGIVAELGVNKGEFSQEILRASSPRIFHLADVWGSERYPDGLRKGVESKFQNQIDIGRVKIHQGYSTDLASSFENGFFDWIYMTLIILMLSLGKNFKPTRVKSNLEVSSPAMITYRVIGGRFFGTG